MKSRFFLIATARDDMHAFAVKAALTELGHGVALWFTSDLPARVAATCRFTDDGDSVQLCGDSGLDAGCAFDAFWFRRWNAGDIGESIHPADREFVAREISIYTRGLMELLSERAVAINSVAPALRAESKPWQLLIAKKVGLQTPDTLMSNDPFEIRRFLRSRPQGSFIYKSFYPANWQGAGKIATLYTSIVSANDLPSDHMLRYAPGIYQERVSKAFEVRITCMGARLIAVKLDSQNCSGAELDWRSEQRNPALTCEEIDTPDEVARQCRSMLKMMGLRFACFDFVVTPQGRWVFLEVNQMGQFLWIEQLNPSIRMLDRFVCFLLDPDANDVRLGESFGLSFHEFFEPAMQELNISMEGVGLGGVRAYQE